MMSDPPSYTVQTAMEFREAVVDLEKSGHDAYLRLEDQQDPIWHVVLDPRRINLNHVLTYEIPMIDMTTISHAIWQEERKDQTVPPMVLYAAPASEGG